MKPAAILLLLLGTPALAQELAPATSIKPEVKAEQSAPEASDAADPQKAGDAKPADTPDTPDTPDTSDTSDTPDTSDTSDTDVSQDAPNQETPDTAETKPPEPGMRDQLRETDAVYAACLMALDRAGVRYTEVDPIIPEDDRDCGILRPIEVTEVAGGIAISPSATLRCETALALSDWTGDFVLPAAARLSKRGTLSTIENGSGYVCRRRNGTSDGKPSEHSFGNALDVMGFGFDDGSRIAVEPREAEGSIEEAFQDAVRAAACMDFSTVLGPGSNAAHDNHLHLDVLARSGGWRLCEQGGAQPD